MASRPVVEEGSARQEPAAQAPEEELALIGAQATQAERARAEQLVQLLRAVVAGVTSDERAAEALHEMSLLLASPLGDTEGALEAAKAAFQRNPDDFRHARAFRKAALRHGSREDWALAVDAEIRGAPTSRYRTDLGLARARQLELTHGDVDEAKAAYQQVIELGPESEALFALTAIALADRSFAEAAKHAAALADVITDPLIAAEHLARAARYHLLSDDLDAARAAAARARELAPTEPGVLHARALVALTADGHETIVKLRAEQVEGGIVPVAQARFDQALVARYRLGDDDLAISSLEAALPLVQDDTRRLVLEELTTLLEGKAELERWAALTEERAGLETSEARRLHLLVRLGRVRAEVLGDDEGALSALGAALEADPCHGPALEAAGRLYERLGRRDKLLEMHRLEAKSAKSTEERARAAYRLGRLLVEEEEGLDEGIEELRGAADVLPENLAVFSTLERALTKKQDWAALRDAYASVLEGAEPRRKHWLLLQIARLSADWLDDRARAVEAYREAAELDFSTPAALQPLRQLALVLDASTPDDRPALREALERLAEAAESPAESASHSERLAELLSRDGDEDRGLDVLRGALTTAPRSHPIQRAAGRAFLRAGRFEELAAFFDDAAEHAEGADKARWLHKAADVWSRNLSKVDEALTRLREAASLDPENATIGLALEELFETQQCWPDLRERLTADDDPRALMRRGAFAEAEGDDEGALDCYARARDAGLALARLPAYRMLTKLERWKELSTRYAGDASEDPRHRAHLRYRAAAVVAEQLDDTQKAIALFGESRSAAPDALGTKITMLALTEPGTEGAATLLAELTEQTADPKLKAILSRRRASVLAALGSDEEARALAVTLLAPEPDDPGLCVFAELSMERAGDRQALVELLRTADPESALTSSLEPTRGVLLARALEELGAIREAADAYEAATSGDVESPLARLSLPRLYASMNDDARLDESLRSLAIGLPNGPLRAHTFRVLAGRREAAGDVSGAITSYESALGANPLDFEGLRALEALCKTEDDWTPIIDALLRAFGAASEPAEVTQLGCHVASMLLRQDRLDAAREALERAHAVNDKDGPTLMLLVEACERLGDFPSVANCLDELIALADTDPEVSLTAHRKLVQVVVQELGDLERAAVAADALCELCPADPEALDTRLDVHRRAENHVEMARTLDELVELSALSDAARVEYLLELASIHEDKLDDAAAAIRALGSVRSAEHRREAAERLLRLGESTGRWDLASEALVSALDVEGEMDPEWETTVRTRLAELFEGPVDESEAAVKQYQRLVELDSRNGHALTRLVALVDDPERSLEYRQLLFQVRPSDHELLRSIRETYVERSDEDAAFCAEAYVVGLRVPTEEEEYFYRQRRTFLGSPDLEEGLAAQLTVLAPVYANPWVQILNRLEPALTTVFPTDFGAYDVDPEQAQPSDGPLFALIAELAGFFGVERYRFHLAAPRISPTVELVDGVRHLILPRTLADATRREQQFVLGALMLRTIVGGLWSDPARANPLTPKYLGYVIDAVRHLSAEEDVKSPILKDILRRMETALKPELRAEVEELLQNVPEKETLDGRSLQRSVAVGAARAGVLIRQDPAVAVSAMRQWPAMFDFGDQDESTKLPVPCAEALPFAVTAEHLELRRRFKLGVSK